MRTIIVDDERLARNELRRLLEAFPHIEIVAEATNGEEAIEKIQEFRPELVFLDIQMPGKNGFEVLEALDQSLAPDVIFTTAYDEYALKAFDFDAIDYLLKPIDEQRLEQALKKLEEDQKVEEPGGIKPKVFTENDQVFVKDGNKYWFIRLNEVRLFESIGNYVRIYFENNKPLILRSLNALEERLDPQVFFRANRKHIINLRMIESIEPYFSGGILVKLRGGEKIEVSRRQAVKFKDHLSL
ncbi:MAG TPA: response regulator [Catalimonadaceae bacterium]|jgi:two-component system LytT family response regulator|nr:response regulator [Catalimonadaceae bacterium]